MTSVESNFFDREISLVQYHYGSSFWSARNGFWTGLKLIKVDQSRQKIQEFKSDEEMTAFQYTEYILTDQCKVWDQNSVNLEKVICHPLKPLGMIFFLMLQIIYT